MWSFLTHVFPNSLPCHGCDRKTFDEKFEDTKGDNQKDQQNTKQKSKD